MSDDTRDLAQRIRDALAIYKSQYGGTVNTRAEGIDRYTFSISPATYLIEYVALLRDALARIEADAARIEALEAEVARLSDKLRPSEVDPTVCDMCEGTGKVNRLNRDGSVEPVDCRACWGTGTNRRAIGYDDDDDTR